MVELGSLPIRCRVTGIAFGRNVALCMGRVGGLLEVGQVAARAVHRCAGESAAYVASGALHGLVRARQCKTRGVVVELCALPTDVAVAGCAVVRESRRRMRRVLGGVEIGNVASEAVGGSAGETAAHVTGDASQPSMRAHQCEVGKARVIEFRALPAIHSMAALTLQRKLRCSMVRRLRFLIIAQVAAHALRTQADEYTAGRPAMAGIARNGGVRSKQREPVQMILQCVRRSPPAPDRMAILAGRAELAAMEIGVTVRALLAYLRKDLADMTLAASHVLVQAPQGEFRLRVMVELCFGTNGLPTGRRVAALARRRQRTMRIRSPRGTGVLCTHKSSEAKQQYRK